MCFVCSKWNDGVMYRAVSEEQSSVFEREDYLVIVEDCRVKGRIAN